MKILKRDIREQEDFQEGKGEVKGVDVERVERFRESEERERMRNDEAKGEVATLSIVQETSWRNTKFFHRVVVTNKRRNFIESLKENEVVFEGEEEVKGRLWAFTNNSIARR